MVRIEQAAAQLDVPMQTIDQWAEQGLLEIHDRTSAGEGTEAPGRERLVDEDQLHAVAESLGWLQLSQDNW